MKFATELLHRKNFDSTGATTLPIYQSAAFFHENAEDMEKIFAGRKPGFIYTRVGNPTAANFEQRIANLEHGIGAVAFSSGMAAISAAVMNVVESGDEIISSGGLFGGTSNFFRELKSFGVKINFVENSTEKFAEKITDKTKIIYVETIGNPKLDVANISELAKLAREKNILLFVDSTVTTPFLIRPLEFGADVVIHSTSKMMNGGGNSIGGIVICGKNFSWDAEKFPKLAAFKKFGVMSYLIRLRSKMLTDFGGCPSPFNIFLTNIGLDTLALRMEKSCDNALKLANFLSEKNVEVNYPGLKNNFYHELAKKQFRNFFGTILTLKFGTKDRAFKFLNAVNLAKNVSNIGDARTLIVHPDSTIYFDASAEEKKFAAVTEDLIRVSVGIEDIEDLLEDFEQGLKKL